jgi:hypothetical protein
MPTHRYPRPPITLAGIFLAPPVEAPPALPAWWPNDKHRELTFRAPTGAVREVWR